MAALGHVVPRTRHVVAQVVEAELVVGPVGEVGRVGGPLEHGVVDVGPDAPDGEAQELVQPAHPLGVKGGQILVDRHDMHALSGQRIQIGRERRHQRLALAGAHLGDAPLM